LRHAINEAWGERETRPFVPAKALDVGLTLVVAPLGIVALGLTLSGSLANTIGDHPWIVAAAQFAVTRVLPFAILFGLLVLLLRVLPEAPAGLRAAWPGALVGLVGALAVRFGLGLWFAVFGDASAVYGTIGALLAVVLSVYFVAIAIVFGAHVSAQVARLPDVAAMDRALQQNGGSSLGALVRGLFVRKPR
jgi:membrane protein